jgi:hypothetical protein
MSGLDVLRARVAFRDRPLADVLDLSLRFCAVHGVRYAKIAAATTLPFLGLTIAASLAGGAVLGWIVALVLSIAAQVPFTVLASRLVFQDDIAIATVLKAALRQAPRLVFVRAFALAIVALASFTLLGGFLLATMFLFLGEVMLLERASVATSLGRARRVAASSVGDAILAILALTLVPVSAVLLSEIGGRAMMTELFQLRAPEPLWDRGWSVLSFIGLFAVAPYAATARFFVYLNIRTRTEGWDIQTKFAGIAARAERVVEAA